MLVHTFVCCFLPFNCKKIKVLIVANPWKYSFRYNDDFQILSEEIRIPSYLSLALLNDRRAFLGSCCLLLSSPVYHATSFATYLALTDPWVQYPQLYKDFWIDEMWKLCSASESLSLVNQRSWVQWLNGPFSCSCHISIN